MKGTPEGGDDRYTHHSFVGARGRTYIHASSCRAIRLT